MSTIKIKKGLDIPIAGRPEQRISSTALTKKVAVLGPDYVGMKPTMAVVEGDQVAQGQPLFEDKKNPGVIFTAPVGGKVTAINRGERRVLQSVVIEVNEESEAHNYTQYSQTTLADLNIDAATKQLVDSGLWTALRTRPYSKVPAPGSKPAAIFVTATDTNPLAVDPTVVVSEYAEDFKAGVQVLSKLTEGKLFVCAGTSDLPLPDGVNNLEARVFTGVHPAGNAGTHIHYLRSASLSQVVWSIGYQDTIAIGKLFLEGKIWGERIISIGGPQVKSPEVVRTRLGADLDELMQDRLLDGENRVISGSILNGRQVEDGLGFLGRYHLQVSALLEGRERPLLHYVQAGRDRFSALPIYISSLMPKKLWNFSTTTNGSERAMVPIGAYERIMPFDILPTQLLRALIVGDTASAQKLGALELDEEDLALCTFVCPGKYEYGPILRDNLERIEKEG